MDKVRYQYGTREGDKASLTALRLIIETPAKVGRSEEHCRVINRRGCGGVHVNAKYKRKNYRALLGVQKPLDAPPDGLFPLGLLEPTASTKDSGCFFVYFSRAFRWAIACDTFTVNCCSING